MFLVPYLQGTCISQCDCFKSILITERVKVKDVRICYLVWPYVNDIDLHLDSERLDGTHYFLEHIVLLYCFDFFAESKRL